MPAADHTPKPYFLCAGSQRGMKKGRKGKEKGKRRRVREQGQ